MQEVDLIVIANNNKYFKSEKFHEALSKAKKECIILDGWNVIDELKGRSIIKLGVPFDWRTLCKLH
jgi:hypothetical protein